MARTVAELPKGSRITDYISVGVISKTFPLEKVNEILQSTGRISQRQRDLPAHVVIYYVLALALFMQVSYREVLRCLLEGIEWLSVPGTRIKVTGKSGISQARTRLGSDPLKQLHDAVIKPIAGRDTKGAWYRRWHLVTLDGSTMETADNRENEAAFGRPGASRGRSGYPQIRFASLVENGTHVLFGTQLAGCRTAEATLAREVIPHLEAGMLCLADRYFFGFELWQKAQSTGTDLLWRVRKIVVLPCFKRLPDGSYLSRIYARRDRRTDTNGVDVRVIEYVLEGSGSKEIYRLVTTILDHEAAPAQELAALYCERWEIETALDELKTHLRGSRIQLRSKTPDLVRQEFYGLMMTHFAIRGLMHEAAIKGDIDPDKLSFVHAVRVVRRKLASFTAFSPSGQESAA
ncbi:MAG: IS4 family transposase [Dehalococcoidales bacterium]|nr:IS4 family transposase [Dehalococcoidales bacterium]